MSGVWSWLLGLEQLEGADVERWTVQWARLETPFQAFLFLLAAAGACCGVWWFYRQEPAYCSRWRKMLLAALRSLGLMVLLLILAGPVLALVKSSTLRGKVVILVDVSKSMSRKERYQRPEDKLAAAHVLGLLPLAEREARKLPAEADAKLAAATRLDLVRALLRNREIRLLQRLARDYEVEIYTFARAADLACVSAESGARPEALDGVAADGPSTEIGGALRAVAERLKGQPLAAVLLITDGANNRGEEPVAAAEDLSVPIFPIGIGLPQTRDLAVGHFFVESKLFLDDPAPLYVRLKQQGLSGEQCQLVVSLGGEELARQAVSLKPAGEQTEVARIRPRKAGRFTLRVEVAPLPGEGESGNNGKEREVEVLDKKVKVLLVEAEPRWEYRCLFNALQRDQRVELQALLRVPDLPQLAVPGSMYVKEFPRKGELFKYDAVILGNVPNDAAWTEQDLENLRRFVVAEGGGLWLIAGRNAMPDSYRESRLELLIPVEFERRPEVDAEDERRSPLAEGFRAVLTPEGRTHSLMRLDAGTGTEEENAGLWELLPDLYWHHKATRAKLGATVLLAHGGRRGAGVAVAREGPAPLLVTAQVGRGRVLYSAIEELWRMRFPIELGPDALDRFFGHAVQYLGLAHCLGGSPRLELTTDRDEYAAGDRVKVTARILSKETYEPSAAEHFTALARDLENEARVMPFELSPVAGQPGIFRGELAAAQEGRFRVSLKDEEEQGAYGEYRVRTPQVEMDAPEMKEELLEQIAGASRPAGGAEAVRFYLPDQAGAIPDALRVAQRRVEYRLEDPLWDAPLTLVLFVLLLGTEWLLRKRGDLC